MLHDLWLKRSVGGVLRLVGRRPGRFAAFVIGVVVAMLFGGGISQAQSAGAAWEGAQQWVPYELSFTTEVEHAAPFAVRLMARLTGSDGSELEIPAFYDGEGTWRVRFTPTAPGEWSYITQAEETADEALHGRSGRIVVAPASGENPLYAHGGILRVSENRRYLTYSDGTPFFWLGDTWWFCPSSLCPIDGSSNPDYDSMYKTLIDLRSAQGYTVVQMTFLGSDGILNEMAGGGPVASWEAHVLDYWRDVDRYLEYANEAGILPVVGLAFHSGMDQLTLEQWIEVWRYFIARYAAYPITWLITGEYNQFNVQERVEKVLALGQAIKDMDPYKRAMTVHPWAYGHERRQAWDEPWYDFIMLQGGHGSDPDHPRVPPDRAYFEPYNREEVKPVLESETNYEGIHGMGADAVRLAAYRAIQLGSFGYTYGAHGLWYPTQSEDDDTFAEWGTPIPWWVAMKLPGGAQMTHLRRLYESVTWWELEPRANAVRTAISLYDAPRILAKVRGDQEFVVYFPMFVGPSFAARLTGLNPELEYTAEWMDPRTGEFIPVETAVTLNNGEWLMPNRPGNGDWVLVVRAR